MKKDYIEVVVNSTTKAYYKEKGYDSKVGETIVIKTEDLKENSSVYEERICDCCGTLYGTTHQALQKSFNSFGEDVCPICVKTDKYKKIKNSHRVKTNIEKYGSKSPCENEEIKQKMKNTNMERYGVESTLMTKEVKQKSKETLFSKYGVDNPLKSKEILEKVKETNLKKYGYDNPQKNKQIQEKTIKTNLSKYGVEFTTQVPEVRQKMTESLYLHGNVATSSQQYYIFDKLIYLYKEAKIELNKPFLNYFLDIEFILNGIKIDIEYDGKFWHQNEEKDKKRDANIENFYKILRIKSKSKVPSDEELIKSVNLLLNTSENKLEIILQDYND